MKANTYLYNINYQDYEDDLCAMEMRALFGMTPESKVFFQDKCIEPSISPFIKNRMKIIYKGKSLEAIVKAISDEGFASEGFKVQYVALYKRDEHMKKGKVYSKDVGFVITGFPDFVEPKVIYGLTCYEDTWYFGELVANNMLWKAHIDKPYAYSSAIGIHLAKALLNIGTKGNKDLSIIDPCCGVGTVLLEGCFSDYKVIGGEIKDKVADQAQMNLEHYGYEAQVVTGNICDIQHNYDVAIVDMPYGNFSHTDIENQLAIIRHAHRISNRLVLVTSEDKLPDIEGINLQVMDACRSYKNKRRKFVRYVWVCQ